MFYKGSVTKLPSASRRDLLISFARSRFATPYSSPYESEQVTFYIPAKYKKRHRKMSLFVFCWDIRTRLSRCYARNLHSLLARCGPRFESLYNNAKQKHPLSRGCFCLSLLRGMCSEKLRSRPVRYFLIFLYYDFEALRALYKVAN